MTVFLTQILQLQLKIIKEILPKELHTNQLLKDNKTRVLKEIRL